MHLRCGRIADASWRAAAPDPAAGPERAALALRAQRAGRRDGGVQCALCALVGRQPAAADRRRDAGRGQPGRGARAEPPVCAPPGRGHHPGAGALAQQAGVSALLAAEQVAQAAHRCDRQAPPEGGQGQEGGHQRGPGRGKNGARKSGAGARQGPRNARAQAGRLGPPLWPGRPPRRAAVARLPRGRRRRCVESERGMHTHALARRACSRLRTRVRVPRG